MAIDDQRALLVVQTLVDVYAKVVIKRKSQFGNRALPRSVKPSTDTWTTSTPPMWDSVATASAEEERPLSSRTADLWTRPFSAVAGDQHQ